MAPVVLIAAKLHMLVGIFPPKPIYLCSRVFGTATLICRWPGVVGSPDLFSCTMVRAGVVQAPMKAEKTMDLELLGPGLGNS